MKYCGKKQAGVVWGDKKNGKAQLNKKKKKIIHWT